MERPPFPTDSIIVDGLPLQRLYVRFDEIAAGRTKGNSSAAHRSVVEPVRVD